MTYVVIGAGAIGCAVGIALMNAGRRVTFVARGHRLDDLRAHGLTVVRPTGRSHHQINVAAAPGEVRLAPGDVLLLAVKSPDTAAALRTWAATEVTGQNGTMRATAGQLLPVVCLQNGVANERTAQRYFDHVIGASVWVPSQLAPEGVLTLPSRAGGAVDFGRYPRGVDATTERMVSDLALGGVTSRPTSDITRLKHYKLARNVGDIANALLRPGDDAEAVAAAARREAFDVFAAAGIDMSEYKGECARITPLTRTEPVESSGYLGSSTLQALIRHPDALETDYLNGEVALLSHLLGTPASVNRALQRLANDAVRRGLQPQSLTLDDFERAHAGSAST